MFSHVCISMRVCVCVWKGEGMYTIPEGEGLEIEGGPVPYTLNHQLGC